MKKFLLAGACACLAAGAQAAFSVSGYGSFDVSSAYVLYGSRLNKEPCAWTYAELSATDDTWGGVFASLWQNTDLTSRRRAEMRRMNEWDWTAGARTRWAFAEDWALGLEAGHVWYKYHGLNGPAAKAAYQTMMEIFGRLELENPHLTPYLFAAYDWKVTDGTFATVGLKRACPFSCGLVLTPDFTLGGGDDRYLACLYPPWGAGRVKSGLSYVQAALKAAYPLVGPVGLHATLAYCVLVNDRIRSALHEDSSDVSGQFVWGAVGLDVSF